MNTVECLYHQCNELSFSMKLLQIPKPAESMNQVIIPTKLDNILPSIKGQNIQ